MSIEVSDNWTECGSTVKRPADLTTAVEALNVGDVTAFDSPRGSGYNSPATAAARVGKRLGRRFKWRRAVDPDMVEVTRTA